MILKGLTCGLSPDSKALEGLNTCTRCLPITARRKRRISSSVLPENIGPQMTSTQPAL